MPAEIIRFDQPWLLICCVAAVLPIFFARRAARRGTKTTVICVAAQSLAILLLALAVTGPVLRAGDAVVGQCLVLRDASQSTRDQLSPAIALPDGVACREMFFADRIYSSDPRTSQAGESSMLSAATVARNALMLAVQSQDCPACVLVTDGQFTDADWPAAARQVASSGRKLLIVPMDRPPRDARIAAMFVGRTSAGKAELAVTVGANYSAERTLTMSQEFPARRELATRKLVLVGGEDQAVRVEIDAPADSAAEYLASLDSGDAFAENDSFRVALAPEKQSIAIISSASAESFQPLAKAISAASGAKVDFISSASLIDPTVRLRGYSAVVLVDSAGQSLAPSQRLALADYVRSGGGLVLIGVGPNAAPADRDDPLNSVAALVGDPFSRNPLRILLAIDVSGSMTEPADNAAAGKPAIKFDLAREAASAIGKYVTPQDSLAVIVFADSPKIVYDSRDAAPDFDAMRRSLATIAPAGKTDIAAAILQAGEISRFDGPTVRRPLLLLLSDLQPNAQTEFDLQQSGDIIRRAGMELGIVQTQGRSDQGQTALMDLAKSLSAPIVTDVGMKGVGEIFGKMIRRGRGDTLRRGKWDASFPPEMFGGKSVALPQLDAILVTYPNKSAEVIGKVQEDRPLVGAMKAGFGRSVSIAVPMDMPDACSSALQRNSLARLAGAAAGWVARRDVDLRVTGQIFRSGGELTLKIIFAPDAAPPAGGILRAAILPLGQSATASGEPMTMARDSLREFSVRISDPSGNIAAQVVDSSGAAVWRGGSQSVYPAEFSAIGCNWENLRRLAELSGGSISTTTDVFRAGIDWEKSRDVPIWYVLLIASVAVVLAEWVLFRPRSVSGV